MSIPTKISCPCVGKYETELTRGAEILMRVFCAVSERRTVSAVRVDPLVSRFYWRIYVRAKRMDKY